MQGEHHDLAHEFPKYKDEIHYLKMHDMHFCRLFDEYHNLTNSIEGIEKNNSNVADSNLKKMKLNRLALKDDLYKIILDNKKKEKGGDANLFK